MRVALAAPGVGVTRLYANVYLLRSAQGRVLVDTGTPDHARAFSALLRAFAPDAVLLTHRHLDHAGNAWVAARRGMPLLAPPLEAQAIAGDHRGVAGRLDTEALALRLLPRVPLPHLRPAEPGQDVLGWQVVALPGHTEGQVGLLRDGVLVAADAVIADAGGAAHLPRASYNWDNAQALATLRAMTTMDLRLILPGHGGPLTPQQVRARAERDG